MKARGGGSDGAPVMGQGSAHTKASRGGVGYYGKCRRQREVVQQHEKGRQERGNRYGWRHKGRYAVNALGVSEDKGEKVETRARDKAEREQKRGRPPVPKTKCKITERRMRMNEMVESRGGRPSGTEGNTVDSWEEKEQNQVGMEEAHNPEQDSQMQKRRSGRGKWRPLEDMQPEEADIRKKKARGRGEGDCMGSPSSAIGQGSKVKEGNKVGARCGRGYRGKGRRRQAGN